MESTLAIPDIFEKKAAPSRSDEDSKKERHSAQKRVNAKMHYALAASDKTQAKNKWKEICDLPGRRAGKNDMKKQFLMKWLPEGKFDDAWYSEAISSSEQWKNGPWRVGIRRPIGTIDRKRMGKESHR